MAVDTRGRGATVSSGRASSTTGAAPVGEGHDALLAGMQRRRLLRAFLEVVADGGFQGASIERICRRAGVSRRTFYEVFTDAEDCCLAVVDGLLEQLSGELSPVFSAGGPWRARMREALVTALSWLDAEPGSARMLIAETGRAGPAVAERRARVLEELASAVDEGRGEARAGGRVPPLAAQGVVGAVLHVLQTRLEAEPLGLLGGLAPELMAIVVTPYLGAKAAAEEVDRAIVGRSATKAGKRLQDPFKDLPIRFTYRTALVLGSIAEHPGANNRQVAGHSDIADQGQVSRLLTRLHRAGLIANANERPSPTEPMRGEPNAWTLTDRGQAVHAVLSGS